MFTGDASARFLMEALYETGFANQPSSEHREDGLVLRDLYLTSALRCVPPEDNPTREEMVNCSSFLAKELALLPQLRAVLTLGRIAFDAYLSLVSKGKNKRFRLPFRHGARYELGKGSPTLFVSYHPSPRNHNTGRLTLTDLETVLKQVKREIDINKMV